MKVSIEIERLLQWAYRDELPKRAIGSIAAWDTISRYGELLTPIDDQIGPGFPALLGAPHPDAFLKIAAFRPSVLIAMHAKMGTRPDWEPEPPVPRRVMAPDGRNHVVEAFDERGERVNGRDPNRNYRRGARCPLAWDPPPRDIAIARAEYATWHAGLVRLCESLNAGALQNHVALPPAALAEPWYAAGYRQPRVLPDLLPKQALMDPPGARRRSRARRAKVCA